MARVRSRSRLSDKVHLVEDLVVLRTLVGADRLPVVGDIIYAEAAVEAHARVARVRAVKVVVF